MSSNKSVINLVVTERLFASHVGFGGFTVLFCNITVRHDGKEAQRYDSQPNSTGQPLRYYPPPVTSIEITLTHDDRSFMSVVIVRLHFLWWQL